MIGFSVRYPRTVAGEGQRRAAAAGESRRRHAHVQPRVVSEGRHGRRSDDRRQLMRAVLVGGVAASVVRAAPPQPICRPNGPRFSGEPRRRASSSSHLPGRRLQAALKAFTQAIRPSSSSTRVCTRRISAPRILQERPANLYTWDVATIPRAPRCRYCGRRVWDPSAPRSFCRRQDDAAWEGASSAASHL